MTAMRVIRPLFSDGNGDLHRDPIAAAGDRPRIDLSGLAKMFASPSLVGEVTPGAYFEGVTMVWPRPEPSTESTSMKDSFRRSIVDLCPGSEPIAVQTSGGLDSLAVLSTCCKVFPGRKIIALCYDMTDDRGVTTQDVVRALVRDLRLSCEVVVVDRGDQSGWPDWSAYGPPRTAAPMAHAAVARTAKDAGACVLLSGDGADEIVAVHRFSLFSILSGHGAREALSYARDAMRSGPGLSGEILAAIFGVCPARTRMRAYWAINWPDMSRPAACDVLTTEFHAMAWEWADRWLGEALADHVAHDRSWCEAEALDAWWPQPYLPPAIDLPEGSPFLHEDFVATALRCTPSERYACCEKSAYHRLKHGVVSLFDAEERSALPLHKQYFTKAVAAEADSLTLQADCAIALGLFDADKLRTCRDPAAMKLVSSVEWWLREAVSRGITT